MEVVRADDSAFETLFGQLKSCSGDRRHALYGEANLAYYREYFPDGGAVDKSFVLRENGIPVAGMRMILLDREAGRRELSVFGLPVVYLEESRSLSDARAKAQKLIKREFANLLDSDDAPDTVHLRDELVDGELCFPAKVLLDRGATATPGFTQVIDLVHDEEMLHRGLTKAFKWCVNWGKKNLDIAVLDAGSMTAGAMDAFRELHLSAAGRETRTRRSWELQAAMVAAGEAFCVFGRLDGSLVTAALFPCSERHCFYGVSASHRDLFEKPLSHVLIWTAMMHAKNMGVGLFEMGEQLYPNLKRPTTTSKELGISFFKRGFGGVTKPYLDIRLMRDDMGNG